MGSYSIAENGQILKTQFGHPVTLIASIISVPFLRYIGNTTECTRVIGMHGGVVWYGGDLFVSNPSLNQIPFYERKSSVIIFMRVSRDPYRKER